MGFEELDTPNPKKRFLDTVADVPVTLDASPSRARTYRVGENVRVWPHRVGKDFGGINKNARKKLQTDEDCQLVHLIIRASEDELREFVETHGDNLAATELVEWYVLPDEKLEAYSTDGSLEKYNINERNLDEMSAFKYDRQGILTGEEH